MGVTASRKNVITVAVLLLLEAGLILGAIALFSRAPGAAEAGPVRAGWDDAERIVEIPVLNTNLHNDRSGASFLYTTEVFVQVRGRNRERVEQHVAQFRQEIRAQIAAIWRESEPHHFQEPKLETLTRQVQALLNRRMGQDRATGDPVVVKTIVVMGTGFRVG